MSIRPTVENESRFMSMPSVPVVTANAKANLEKPIIIDVSADDSIVRDGGNSLRPNASEFWPDVSAPNAAAAPAGGAALGDSGRY